MSGALPVRFHGGNSYGKSSGQLWIVTSRRAPEALRAALSSLSPLTSTPPESKLGCMTNETFHIQFGFASADEVQTATAKKAPKEASRA